MKLDMSKPLPLTFPSFFPSAHYNHFNLKEIFNETWYIWLLTFSILLPNGSIKSISSFTTKKSLMKPDTFDF